MSATYLLRPGGEWLVREREAPPHYGGFSVIRNPCWKGRPLRESMDVSSVFWWTDALEFA